MATYIPDPYDPTEPLGTQKARTAAEEFRNFKTAAALINKGNIFTKAQTVTPVVLTSAASVAVDATPSNHFVLALAHNATLANPTGMVNGQVFSFRVKQTGAFTLAYGSKYKFPTATVPVIGTTVGDSLGMSGVYYSDVDEIWLTSSANFG